MRDWFKDASFRSVLKNSSYLAISKAVAAVASLASLAFAGRGLGLLGLGALILITSYAQAASGLTKFQSWQLIVRYGGNIRDSALSAKFRQATGFALGLDLASGLIGMAAAIALLPLIGPRFGIKPEDMTAAMLYCTLLPTMSAATPNGVVRALDRFDLLSWQGVITPIGRALLAGIAWLQGWGLLAYIAIWYVTDLVGDLYLWAVCWREMKRQDLIRGIRPTLTPTGLDHGWRFAIYINLTASLMSAWGPIARLIVGSILGEAAAALYRIAASLADSAQKPADLLARAYYPEVVRMDMTTKHPWRLMLRATAISALIAGSAVVVVLIGGKPLIGLIFGKQFLPAYPALMIMLAVPLLTIVSFPLPSTLYALDRPDAPLQARLVATIAYFLLVVPLAHYWALPGAALAYAIANAVLAGVLLWMVANEYRRVRAARIPSPG